MMAMRDWRARLYARASVAFLLLAGVGCCGGYTLIDQTARTSPAWVETTTPARDARAAPGDGREVTPRADQDPAATVEASTTGIAEPAVPSHERAAAGSATPVPEEPQ